MELQLPKGTRDFAPEEKLARDEVVGKLVQVFARYGFLPLETPEFERLDVLTAKYAGGAEILKETFTFKDQGERELGLRYDLTVPLARFCGMNPQLKLPFKRYAVGRVFRDGPTKLGRYREFYQCDVDTVGAASMLADAECLLLGQAVFAALGINARFSVNNRKLLEAMLLKGGVAEPKLVDAMLTLDKLKKIPIEDLKKEFAQKGIPEASVSFVISLTKIQGNEARIARVKEYVGDVDGLKELLEVLSYLDKDAADFDPSLSRGLAYYTSTVFEAFVPNSNVTSSVSGGGRYDNMIGEMLGKGPNAVPAVGISFGLEPILDVLAESGAQRKTSTSKVYVAPIKTQRECLPIVAALRAAGINAELDLKGRNISGNLEYASALGIPYVLICGQRELAEGKVKLRDMVSGAEELLSVDETITKLQRI